MKFIVALIVLTTVASAEITSVELKSAAEDTSIGTCKPYASETPVASPKWTSEFIYPIEVCAMFTENLKACEVAPPRVITPSKITLQMKDGSTLVAAIDRHFTLGDNVVGPKLYCSTFDACDILAQLTAYNYAKDLSGITLVGKVEVSSAEKEGTDSNPNLKAVLRGSGWNIPEKTAEKKFENLFGNPFSVTRKSTFCDDSYDCITEMSNAKLSPTVTKMVLVKGDKLPTCMDTATAEQTKLHMTTFARNDGEVCSWNGVNGDCVSTLTIYDEDHPTTSTTLTTSTSGDDSTTSTSGDDSTTTSGDGSTTPTSEAHSTTSTSGAINHDSFATMNTLALISLLAIIA